MLGTAKRLKIRPNKTPAQPLISHDTYLKLLKASKSLPQYVGTFIVLAEGTGRRLGAIRNLSWDDVSLDEGSILWRADSDKMGLEVERVAPAQVIEALRSWKESCLSEIWVFPAPADASLPVPKPTVDKWMRQIYEAAKLTKPARVGWHSLRRKWATERKGYALPDLMAGGGWASSEALMRYLKTDDETIRTVIQQPTRRVTEKVITEVRTGRKTGTGKTLQVA